MLIQVAMRQIDALDRVATGSAEMLRILLYDIGAALQRVNFAQGCSTVFLRARMKRPAHF